MSQAPNTIHTPARPPHRRWRALTLALALALVAAACGSDDPAAVSDGGADPTDGCFADPGIEPVSTDGAADEEGPLTLLTHDSFALSEGTLDAFTAETGIEVQLVQSGDAGEMVAQAILADGNPVGDVLFGVDNTFLCSALLNDVFVPYRSGALDTVASDLQIDPHHRVTPIDYGDVCANYWISEFGEVAPPTSMEALADPAYADLFVTENPETSSPGFAFLLATIARFGEDGWEDYWRSLVDNGLSVTAGWEDAYYGEFIAGGGDRPIVMSYASSPAAEVLFADPPVETAPTGVIADTCYRQIEFAGILRGTDSPAGAAQLVDFLLSPTVQEDIPLNMFVYPANGDAALPDVFVDHAATTGPGVTLDPAIVEENRLAWTERWTAIIRG